MSAVVRNYYYADAPSPLHEALDAFNAEREKLVARADSLAKSVGAKSAISGRTVVGFCFEGDAPTGWKEAGRLSDGEPYFAPQKRSREDKALHTAMKAIQFIEASTYIVGACRLGWMAYDDSMWRTVCGFKDQRVFVVVPTGGEGNNGNELEIPPYLIPCREWEMKRWFDEGRPAAGDPA